MVLMSSQKKKPCKHCHHYALRYLCFMIFKCLIDHDRPEKQNFNFMWDSWWDILVPDASFAVLGYDLTTSPASGLTIICVALHMQFILFLIITIVVIWLLMWYDPAAIHDSHVVSFYAIWQSPEELIELAHKYYEESAVPKLVSMDGSFHLMLPLYWLISHATTSFFTVLRSLILAHLSFRRLMGGH